MAAAKKPMKKGGTAAGAPLGSGKNFAKVSKSAGGGEKGDAIAASIMRKKYGAKKSAQLSSQGRKRAAKGK